MAKLRVRHGLAEFAVAAVYSADARAWARRAPILAAAAVTQLVLTDAADQARLTDPHKGQCRIGIVSNIKVRQGRVVRGSGELVVREWRPTLKELSPTAYRWTPRS